MNAVVSQDRNGLGLAKRKRSSVDENIRAKRRHLGYTLVQQPIDSLNVSSYLPNIDGSGSRVTTWLQEQLLYQEESFVNHEPRRFRRAMSAPAMSSSMLPPTLPNNLGFPLPSPSLSRRSSTATESRNESRSESRTERLVESPKYRSQNLAFNRIFRRDEDNDLPDEVSLILNQIRKKETSTLSAQEYRIHREALKNIQWDGTEDQVNTFFREKVFPKEENLGVSIATNYVMHMSVPKFDDTYKVSVPRPDMLYGYNADQVFTLPQCKTLSNIRGQGCAGSKLTMVFPFLVVEFKADGSSSGSLWVASNQCMGGASACVNLVDQLNQSCVVAAHDSDRYTLEDAAFSIAMNANEALLFVSWKSPDLNIYTQMIDSFHLRKEESYQNFRKHVLNIVEWGKGTRLTRLRQCLDYISEPRAAAQSNLSTAKTGGSHSMTTATAVAGSTNPSSNAPETLKSSTEAQPRRSKRLRVKER